MQRYILIVYHAIRNTHDFSHYSIMTNRKKIADYKVIGEGTYGCVVEPALDCQTPADYQNKVSKVMKIEDAVDELEEYDSLKTIPNIDNYTVSIPTFCKPKLGVKFSTVVRNCTARLVRDTYKSNPKGLAILLMENGGLDVHNFVNRIFPDLQINDQNKFLTAILDAIKGVQYFNKMDIIHQDIKAPNMVYNIKTNKLKFIDFGLMTTKTKFIESSSRNRNWFAQSWDYFPPEFSCANFSDFDDEDKCSEYRDDYSSNGEPDHKPFIRDLANTFDSYCLSLALKKLFRRDIPLGYREANPFFKEARELFAKYCDPNPMARYDNLDELIADYRNLLKTHGIYDKQHPTPSKNIVKQAESLSLQRDPFASPKKPTCPPKKPDYNPITKKCVAPCKPGKVRNDKFRCVNPKKTAKKVVTKPTKNTSISKQQHCYNLNKDYNPHTKRCIKKCNPHQVRNEKMKCVSRKQRTKTTSKNKTSKNKPPLA